MVKLKAYRSIASIVSRDYFICGDDFGFIGGQVLDLASFLEIVIDRPNFVKIARGVIEAYKGAGSLNSILSCIRWKKDLRTMLATLYISELPDLVSVKDLIAAIQFDLLTVALQIFQLHLEVHKSDEDNLCRVIVNSFKRNGYLEEKLHLTKNFFQHFHYEGVKELLNLNLSFSTSMNPIKVAAHYYEILMLIESNFTALKIKTKEKRMVMEELISSYGNADESMLKHFVLDRDLEGRTTIELVDQLQLVDFFTKLEPIIDELWRSPYERKGQIFQTSTSYFICCKSNVNHPKPINPCKWNPAKRSKNHPLRYHVWRASPMTRFFVESFYILAITIYLQLILVQIQGRVRDLEADQLAAIQASTDQTIIHQLQKEVTDQIIRIIGWFTYMESSTILLGSFLLLPFYDFWAQMPLQKPFKWGKIIYLLDLVAVCMFSFFLAMTYQLVIKNRSNDESQDFYKEITDLFREVYVANQDEFQITLGIGIMAMWLRVVLIFRASEFLGPFVKVIGKMVKDIMIFFVLYLVIIVSFASVGNLAFGDISFYSNLTDAIVTLFGSSLGGFDFTILDTAFGQIYLAIFLIVSLILLLNLLIAILSTTYSYYETRGRGLYLQEILTIWEDVQYGGNRGFYVIRTFPFHVITLPFIPFLACCNNKTRAKCDGYLQGVQFIPSILVHIIFQITISAICLPFAYLKLFFHSAASIGRYRGRARCLRFMIFLQNFFLGVPILIFRLLIDIGFLVYDDFQLTPLGQQLQFEGVFIHHELLKILIRTLEKRVNHKNYFQACFTRDILLEVRDSLGIKFTYTDVAALAYKFKNYQDRHQSIVGLGFTNQPRLEQFSLLKKYLLQNSYIIGKQVYKIYPAILLKIIEEFIHLEKRKKKILMKSLTSLAQSPSRRKVVTPHKFAMSRDKNFWDEDPRLTFADKRKNEIAQGSLKNFDSLSERYSEIEESEEVASDPFVDLPPLSISHFARIEENLTKAGEEPEDKGPDMEQKLERIQKILLQVLGQKGNMD